MVTDSYRRQRNLLQRTTVLVTLAVLVASCGGPEDDVASSTTAATGTTNAAADGGGQGGDLTIAVDVDLRFADALNARDSSSKLILNSTVFDALFEADEAGISTPSLATEAVPSDDLLEWIFTTRTGVTFHNGEPFSANDVVKLLDAILDPANAAELAVELANIESYEAVDDEHVKFTLIEPDAELPAIFTDAFFIQYMDEFDPEHPIGTGAYQWVDRVPGDRMDFARFPDHWRGVPPLDTVRFRVIPEPQVAVLELQQGNVDIVPYYVAVEALPTLREDPDIELYSTQGTTYYHAFMNMEKARRGGYEDDQAFREGLAYLWNAQEIVPPIIGDFGTVATQPLPPWQLGHDPELENWPYDPDRGKELLAQAGVNEGDTIKLLVHNRPFNCDHGTAVQSALIQLGYDATLQCLEPETSFSEISKWDWDALFYRNSGRPTGALLYDGRWSSNRAIALDDAYTLQDEQIDQMVAEMMATTDRDQYEEIGQAIANRLMKEVVASLPGYWDTVWIAARSNVEGLVVHPLAYNDILMTNRNTVSLSD